MSALDLLRRAPTRTVRDGAATAIVAVSAWLCMSADEPVRAPQGLGDVAPQGPFPDFLLATADGGRAGLWSQPDGTRVTLVALLDPRDPDAPWHEARLAHAAERFAAAGLRVLVVDRRLQERGGHGAASPRPNLILLDDPLAVVAPRLGLARSSDVLLVDRERRLRYRGSALGPTEASAQPASDHLEGVIDALLRGRDPPAPAVGVHGVPLDFHAAPPAITFRAQVAPIVQVHCAPCHRAGGSAPMDLTDYAEAQGWAPAMAEVTASGVMPPWSADPRYGHFKNARRLTDTEKEILRLFAEQGAPRGDGPAPPPVAVAATSVWTIGEPDLVLELPAPQEIPAEGVIDYRSALVHTHLPEDRFIQAIECRPTAMQVTHHVVLIAVPDEVPDEKAAELSLTFPDAVIGGYVPGAPGIWYPPGYGRRLRKGARIVASLHYTPNGKATVDRARIGIRFTPAPPRHEVHGSMLASTALDIPPGAANVQFFALKKVDRPIDLLSFQVHMHARGRGFRYELVRGGERRVLLDVHPFDWNWQHFYDLVEPVRALPGDLLVGIATYDNSAANPRNPDPKLHVKHGPQSNDEMMNGYYSFVDAPADAGGAPPPK